MEIKPLEATAPFSFHDFNPGSTKPLLHLAHANGFPPATYAPLLQPFLEEFHAVALYARPFWMEEPPPLLQGWSVLTEDLLTGLTRWNLKGIVAIGHSLGAVTTLNAAIRKPELFSRVILIDPTMLPPVALWKINFCRHLGIELRKDLVEGTLRRRRHWESREEAYLSFRKKALFEKWSDGILRSYVEGMTAEDEKGGVRLTYSPEGEARIYQTIPTDVWKKAKLLSCPTLVIRGENSNIFTLESEKAFRKANRSVSLEVVPRSGHLVAQEKPQEVGRMIVDFLKSHA